MQYLWSRAAQAQSICRCRVCLHTSSKLARRATTAAPRRRVSGADIFTACYTTILGTAAVIDASWKDARRKELDEKLEQARAAVSKPAMQDTPTQNTEDEYNTRNRTQTRNGELDKAELRTTEALLLELRRLAAATYRSRPRSSWLQYQTDWVEVEAAIAAEERDPAIILRLPQKERHLDLTTKSVMSLVQQLLWQCRDQQESEIRDNRGPTDCSKEARLLDEVESISQSLHFPSYENPAINPTEATEARILLSDSFRRIFNRSTDAKEAICKVCYNLLISRTPPNIHNYNTLIAGFHRIQRPDLAESVINSFLSDSRWPATQQTIVCLLDHARATNNIDLFREIISRMRGVAGDGLHFRIVPRKAIYNENGALWALKYAAARKHAFVERAPRSSEVFNRLVRGWLHFGRVDTASMSFVACLRSGCLVPIDTVQRLLIECLATLDQQTARIIIKGLARNFDKFKILMNYIIHNASTRLARIIADMFYALFDVCGLPYQDPLGNVAKIYTDVLKVFRSLHTATQDHLRSLEIEDSHYLVAGPPDGGPVKSRLDKALTITGQGRPDSSSDTRRNIEYRRLAKIAVLVKRFQSVERKTKRIEAHLKVMIVKRHLGYDLDPQCCLPPVDWHTRSPDEKSPELFDALMAVDLKHCYTSLNSIKRDLLYRMPDRYLARRFWFLADQDTLSFQSLVSFYRHDARPSGDTLPVEAKIKGKTGYKLLQRRAFVWEEGTKAMLFSYLSQHKQKRLRYMYHNWYNMPLAKLLEYHIRVYGDMVYSMRSRQKRRQRALRTTQPDLAARIVVQEIGAFIKPFSSLHNAFEPRDLASTAAG